MLEPGIAAVCSASLLFVGGSSCVACWRFQKKIPAIARLKNNSLSPTPEAYLYKKLLER